MTYWMNLNTNMKFNQSWLANQLKGLTTTFIYILLSTCQFKFHISVRLPSDNFCCRTFPILKLLLTNSNYHVTPKVLPYLRLLPNYINSQITPSEISPSSSDSSQSFCQAQVQIQIKSRSNPGSSQLHS